MTTVREVPASPQQQRLWVIEQDMPGTSQYNMFFEFARTDVLDVASVRAALGDVMQRHETLRTEFRLADGVPHQVVRSRPPVPLAVTDLTGQPARSADAAYEELCRQEWHTPFDLGTAPLLRLRLVRRQAPAGRAAYDTLLLTIHHIVSDAVSVEMVLSDLTTAYDARAAGRAPDRDPLPMQYADYTQWLAERSRAPEAEQDRQFWREHLAGLEDLDLTYGRPRPATPTDRGGTLPVDLDAQTLAAVAALAREQRSTVFMVLLAAYGNALGRVFGATDVPVGMSVSGRALPEVDECIGLFTERLVLRLDIGGRPTFRELVDRCRNEVLAALEHDQVGFDEIVRAAAPSRQYGVVPLTQATFNLYRSPVPDEVRPTRTESTARRANITTVRHDLACMLADTGRQVDGVLEYRSGVVDDAAAGRLARTFLAVLDAGLRDPDTRPDTVPVLTVEELARLHAEQDGGPARDGGGTLPDLVAARTRDTPDATAVDAPDRSLTYRELADEVEEVAARLARHGVVPGAETPVLVAVPGGAALPVCLLGTLAAGGVYVPVDTSAPPAFLATLVRTVGAGLALVSPDHAVRLPATVTSLPVDLTRPAPPAGAAAGRARPHPSSAAYVLLTSGTAGQPKAVTVEHRNLTAYLTGVLDLLAPPPGAVHLLVQPPVFDSSLTTLAGALASGGVLRLVDEGTARDPARLVELLGRSPVDYLKITPSHLAALLAAADPAVLRPRRALVLGGEVTQRGLTDRLRAAGWTVVGHYGPAETTVGVLAHELGDDTGRGVDTVPLGRPLPGVRVRVLDATGGPVPPGCRGELYVGGALVARGYLGAPGRTAEVFRPDPYAAEPGARMYRTGDVVRRLPDGTFEFLGRRDAQVKVRGRRIEPAAVELVLTEVPGVAEAAVLARQDRLVAYVLTDPTGPDVAEIRRHAALQLPAHLVPDVVVPLARLPLTVSGKLDVAALPDPDPRQVAGAGDDRPEPPATPTEEVLAEVWSSVLDVPEVSVNDHFFAAGGDSIRAIYLVAEAADRGLQLTARDVFDNETIRVMAARIDAGDREEPLAVRAAHGGLAASTGHTVLRLTVPPGSTPAPEQALPTEPPGWSDRPGLVATRHGDVLEVAADPAGWDDRGLVELAVAVAAGAGAGPGGEPPGTVEARDATSGAVRVPLDADVAAALVPGAPGAGAVHGAYGTEPVDLAVAALLGALATDRDGSRGGPGEVLLLDAERPAAAPAEGRAAVPAAVSVDPRVAGDRDPGALLRAAKAAVARARSAAVGWTEDALAQRVAVPDVALRMLPLPAGVRVVDVGGRPAAGRTVVVVAGTELVAMAPSPDRAAEARVLGDRVAGALARLVAHCRASAPVYDPADFPDAGLDEAALRRVLERVGEDTGGPAAREPG